MHPGALRLRDQGLTNNPGTDELMVAARKGGVPCVGAAPYYDTDRPGQIRRVFEMAREFDVDIDMHLDSGASAEELDTLLVCDLTEKYGWGGRVAIGHVSKLASMRPPDIDKVARRLADSGVALTVLTATDLYLGGRHTDHNVPRNVVDLNRLAEHGVVCSVASNNILNPFTPFGDGQLLRQANMQAIVTQRGNDDEVCALWDMTTTQAAKLMRLKDYGATVGAPADLVMLDAPDPVTALRTVAPVLAAFKRGRRTVTREPVRLHSCGPNLHLGAVPSRPGDDKRHVPTEMPIHSSVQPEPGLHRPELTRRLRRLERSPHLGIECSGRTDNPVRLEHVPPDWNQSGGRSCSRIFRV